MTSTINLTVPLTKIGDLLDEFSSFPFENFSFKDKSIDSLDSYFLNLMPEKDFVNLKNKCDSSKLKIYDEKCSLDKVFVTIPKRSDNKMKLKSLEAITDTSKVDEDSFFSCYKQPRANPAVNLSFKKCIGNKNVPEILPKEIVVTVCVYSPFCLSRKEKRSLCIQQRIDILGSQTLEDLKNKIFCSECEFHLGDRSDCLDDNDLDTRAGQIYTNNFYHLEELFSDIDNTDQVGYDKEFRSIKDTLINDLSIFLGKSYTYQHLGSCLHSIIFSDIKLLDRYSSLDLSRYPILTGRRRLNKLICVACHRLTPKWIVKDAVDYFFIDPAHVCNVCLRMLLYDKEGKKINNEFKVFRFNFRNDYD